MRADHIAERLVLAVLADQRPRTLHEIAQDSFRRRQPAPDLRELLSRYLEAALARLAEDGVIAKTVMDELDETGTRILYSKISPV